MTQKKSTTEQTDIQGMGLTPKERELLDEFAKAAMAALVMEESPPVIARLAMISYDYAKAMIIERRRREV